jgi:LemA protein
MSVAVTLAVVVALALWALAIYQRLVRLRTAVRRAWGQLEAARSRRREQVTALVEQVNGSNGVEAAVLDRLIAAGRHDAAARGPVAAAAGDRALAAAVTRLLESVDRRPELAANPLIQAARGQLAEHDAALAAARASYNSTAAAYNTATASVPGNVMAGLAGFSPAEPFEPASD